MFCWFVWKKKSGNINFVLKCANLYDNDNNKVKDLVKQFNDSESAKNYIQKNTLPKSYLLIDDDD